MLRQTYFRIFDSTAIKILGCCAPPEKMQARNFIYHRLQMSWFKSSRVWNFDDLRLASACGSLESTPKVVFIIRLIIQLCINTRNPNTRVIGRTIPVAFASEILLLTWFMFAVSLFFLSTARKANKQRPPELIICPGFPPPSGRR